VRNEIGVVTYPAGDSYPVGVVTQSSGGADPTSNAAIGQAAATAVARLQASKRP